MSSYPCYFKMILTSYPIKNDPKVIFILYYLFTAFFNALLDLNAGALLAAIVIVSPVLGLRPVLSPLSRTSKLPNPLRDTLSPFTRASVTTSTNAVTTLSTSVLSFLYLKQLSYY